MKGVLSKVLVFSLFLFSAFYLLFSAIPAHAISKTSPTQAPSAGSGQVNSNINSDVPNNPHYSTQSTMIEIMSAVICQLSGIDPVNPKQTCLGLDQKSGKIGFLPSTQNMGAIGFMGNMITGLYTPPLHTADYFQYLASNFGVTKHAFAQTTGAGFNSLTPLIGVWAAFRNIVYLMLVIVFVVIGLAIMLRIKIDPRTVMTIQNQIPKIIIGILAVTFSFAISGFLIDMMWVFIYLTFGIFNGIQGVNLGSLNPTNIQGQNPLQVALHMGGIFGITNNAANSVKDALQSILDIRSGGFEIFNPFALIVDIVDPAKRGNAVNWLIDLISTGAGLGSLNWVLDFSYKTGEAAGNLPIVNGIPLIGPLIGKSLAGIIQAHGVGASIITGGMVYTGTEYLLRSGLSYIIAYLIILFALLAALFRLWFALIMAYVQILLSVVLAPFWIIGGIIPGSPISLGGWLRNIGANLLAFPTVIAMFMLGKVFMDNFGKAPANGAQNFVPPLIGNTVDVNLVGSLIGIGILLMTPNVVNMLKAALKAPKTDLGLGKAIGSGIGTVSSPFKTVMTGFTFLAGQKMAKGLPIIGKHIDPSEPKTQNAQSPGGKH